MEIMRATKLYQQAGAYYVRIQAMARQHNIKLEEEFDEHDTPDTRYVVILEHDFPVATCRLFGITGNEAEIGRVVVLEEYRGKGIGRIAVTEAEQWLRELGYETVRVNSRDTAIGFYVKLGYERTGEHAEAGTTFVCVPMKKNLWRFYEEVK